MFADLGKDWATGPPNDFNTYIPMMYGVDLKLVDDFAINLYANDHNVIDRPLDMIDNSKPLSVTQ